MGNWLRRWEGADQTFLALVLVLLASGLVFLFSSTTVMGVDLYGDAFFFLKRQMAFAGVGLILCFLLLSLPCERILARGGVFLVLAVFLLSLLHVPELGHTVNGAQRWLKISSFTVQPGEFAKVACILYMSWALSRKGEKVKSFTYGVLPMVLVGGVILGLLLLQPDFGNAVIVASLTILMLFFAGARISYLLIGIIAAIPAALYFVLTEEYRRRRILSFLDPWHDPQNTSYQIIQSYTAFFNGGLWGKGLGNSHEKLYFLPEVHTDFVGAMIAEELGFVGFCLFFFFFLVLILRGFYIASRAQSRGQYLLAAGASTLLGLQAILNLAVIMGLLPTKGLPLPFISNGGSSLIATLLLCGLILSVSNHKLSYKR